MKQDLIASVRERTLAEVDEAVQAHIGHWGGGEGVHDTTERNYREGWINNTLRVQYYYASMVV